MVVIESRNLSRNSNAMNTNDNKLMILANSTTIALIAAGLRTFLMTGCGLVMTSGLAVQADSTLVADGQAHAAVFVSERVWDDATKNPEPAGVWRSLKPEDNRRRLRESVRLRRRRRADVGSQVARRGRCSETG